MSYRPRSRTRTVFAALALSAALFSSTASAYVRATVEGQPGIYLYWASRQVSYWINKLGYTRLALEEPVGAIRRSFSTWSGPACTDFSFVYMGLTDVDKTNVTRKPSERPDFRNIVRWREDAWPPEGATDSSITNDWLALTVLVYNVQTGEILDADMDLNGVNFEWTVADGPEQVITDVQNVVTHEVGHVLGLGHSDVFDATMQAEQPPGEISKRDLHEDDIAGLCAIYPFGRPTSLGTGQPLPPLELIGQSGCSSRSAPARGGAAGALVVLALLAWIGRRTAG